MWVFTQDGFFSVVRDASNPSKVMVRTRCREHAVQFASFTRRVQSVSNGTPEALVVETMDADYPYRVIVPALVWAEYVRETALDIEYTNFKQSVGTGTVGSHASDLAMLLHDVWETVRDWESDTQGPRPHTANWYARRQRGRWLPYRHNVEESCLGNPVMRRAFENAAGQLRENIVAGLTRGLPTVAPPRPRKRPKAIRKPLRTARRPGKLKGRGRAKRGK